MKIQYLKSLTGDKKKTIITWNLFYFQLSRHNYKTFEFLIKQVMFEINLLMYFIV
jgi:hypothetical protein